MTAPASMTSAQRLDQYLTVLLDYRVPQRPEIREVAQHATKPDLTDEQRIAYLQNVMDHNAEKTRVYEVASDLHSAFSGSWTDDSEDEQ